MQITITPEQVALLRAMIDPVYVAHANAECEPPGFSISIDFLGPYGTHAVGHCGNLTVDLGEVNVQPGPFDGPTVDQRGPAGEPR